MSAREDYAEPIGPYHHSRDLFQASASITKGPGLQYHQ